MNLNNIDTEILEEQLEDYALQLEAKDFSCRSNAKAKPQRRGPAGSSPRIVPMERRNWIDIEPGKLSLRVRWKKVIHLRHSQQVHREEDGAVHFWRICEKMWLRGTASNPQPPHQSGHGCTVGYDRGPTRVMPPSRQDEEGHQSASSYVHCLCWRTCCCTWMCVLAVLLLLIGLVCPHSSSPDS